MSGTFGVQLFLFRFHQLLDARKVVFQPRNQRKTWEFMLAEELTVNDAYEMIAHLKSSHHLGGPENDHNGKPGAVLSFHDEGNYE